MQTTAPASISLTLDLSTPGGLALLSRLVFVLTDAPPSLGSPGPIEGAKVEPTTKPGATGRGKNKVTETAQAEPAAAAAVVAEPEPPADETMAQEAAREAEASKPAETAPFNREAAIADVKVAVNACVAKHGIPNTGKVFARFGAEKLGDVKDGDIAALKKALELYLTQPVVAADPFA